MTDPDEQGAECWEVGTYDLPYLSDEELAADADDWAEKRTLPSESELRAYGL